ncbi:hypothetical protein CGMCC3_g4638 [Colletotrichum fructicola]|nr:uncharacterized protein CGMCC3_g4638 [Colletotrichum fructicola]KAE9579338.1 hypothetical protein CGMCC3_g4638 [Colletotrichum fructicola]
MVFSPSLVVARLARLALERAPPRSTAGDNAARLRNQPRGSTMFWARQAIFRRAMIEWHGEKPHCCGTRQCLNHCLQSRENSYSQRLGRGMYACAAPVPLMAVTPSRAVSS